MMKTIPLSITAVAAFAAAMSLAACDQRSNNALNKSTDVQPPSSATAEASQKVAAAGDKVAAVVDDSAITAKVKAALLAEPGLSSLQIGVDTKNSTVTLTGLVDNSMSRERAKQVASSVTGVTNVVDQLTLKS